MKALLFLLWQLSNVGHQLRYAIWVNLRSEGWHFSFAPGNHFCERRITLLLNFVGSEILRVKCFARCAIATAICGVAQDAVCAENLSGIGLGLHHCWQSQDQEQS